MRLGKVLVIGATVGAVAVGVIYFSWGPSSAPSVSSGSANQTTTAVIGAPATSENSSEITQAPPESYSVQQFAPNAPQVSQAFDIASAGGMALGKGDKSALLQTGWWDFLNLDMKASGSDEQEFLSVVGEDWGADGGNIVGIFKKGTDFIVIFSTSTTQSSGLYQGLDVKADPTGQHRIILNGLLGSNYQSRLMDADQFDSWIRQQETPLETF